MTKKDLLVKYEGLLEQLNRLFDKAQNATTTNELAGRILTVEMIIEDLKNLEN